MRRIARGLTGAAVLVIALELAARGGLLPPSIPSPSAVLAQAMRLLVDPTFLVHVGGTLLAWALGLGIAVAVAVPAGVLLGSSPRVRAATEAVVELLRPIPSVALIPLVILLLGRGLDMKLVLVAYASTWPILINTVAGVRSVEPMTIETARVYGIGRRALPWRVLLPAAAPFAWTGLRISAAIALIVAVSAELVAGGGAGIGTWMASATQPGVPRELLFAGIVVTGLLGLAIDHGLVAGERRLFGWHDRARAAP